MRCARRLAWLEFRDTGIDIVDLLVETRLDNDLCGGPPGWRHRGDIVFRENACTRPKSSFPTPFLAWVPLAGFFEKSRQTFVTNSGRPTTVLRWPASPTASKQKRKGRVLSPEVTSF